LKLDYKLSYDLTTRKK